MRHDSGHFTPTKARGLWRAALLGGVLAWGGISQAQTNALSFDGVDDRVSCGTSPSLNLTGNAVTLEAWIYPTSWRTEVYQGNIINKEQDSNNSGYMLRCGANGTLNFNVGGEGEWHEVNSAANALTLNTWQHVAGVYDGTTLHLYLNGVEITTEEFTFNVGASTNPLVIGDWADGVGRNYPGLIDEVRVWNKAVAGATLLANMNTKYCGNETGLIAYYRFDQGTADGTNTTETTLNDQTGYANNGTLSGFALDGTSSNWVSGQTNMADCVPVACPSPILLTISNASTSGFDLTWTDTEASSYEYEVRTAGAAGSGVTGLFTSGTVATGTTPTAIAGITANTSYQAYVRASCDGGLFSDWSPAASIYTGYCNPAPTSVDGDGITNVTFGSVNNTTGSEPGHYADYTAMVGTVQQSTVATVDITFSTAYTYGTKIWVDINNDFDFDDAGELVYTGISTNANPTTLTATFPVGTMSLGQHRMRIGGTDNDPGPSGPCYSGSYGTFEDYTLEVDPPPSCIAPTDLLLTGVTSTSGNFSWTASASDPVNGYQWEVRTANAPGSGTDGLATSGTTASGVTLDQAVGLTANTSYSIYVRSDCGDGDFSTWIGPITLYTGYCTPVGTNSNRYIDDFTTTGGESNIDNSGSGFSTGGYGDFTGMTASTYAGNSIDFSATHVGGTFVFRIWVDWNHDLDFTDPGELVFDGTDYADEHTGTITVPDGTPEGTYVMRIRDNWNGTPTPCGSDNLGETEDYAFEVTATPSCLPPTDVVTTAVTAISVDFSWTASPTDPADGYQWEVRSANGPGSGSDGLAASDATAAGVTNDAASGLIGDTNYFIYVRSICGDGDTSSWTSGLGFTTPPSCLAPTGLAAMNVTNSSVDFSWTASTSGPANGYQWEIRTANAPGSGSDGLATSGSTAAGVTNASASDLTENTTYYIYVLSDCGDGTSAWVGPVNFYTDGGLAGDVVFSEDFAGGSSDQFTVESDGSDCSWLYAPTDLDANNFNQDNDGALPSGANFDSSFVFLDSDECGASGVSVNSYLVSVPFDASAPGNYILTLSQQFQALNESFAKIEVFDGTTWNQVAYYTDNSVGYPNPAVSTSLDITAATGGSSAAQVRFQYSSGWDWWWAIDDVVIVRAMCVPPPGLAVTNVTMDGGTISWADNGSVGYDWVVTTGDAPDGTNAVAEGDGSQTLITGLDANTDYSAWIRSDCGDGSFSGWAGPVDFHTGYCISTSDGTDSYFSDFTTTGGITNISNESDGISPDGYGDFTDMVVSQSAGLSVDFATTIVNPTVGTAIWVDWNNDLDFDDLGEQVFATTAYGDDQTGTITVPDGTPLGSYRMRIRCDYNNSTPLPCDVISFGETEDYTFEVVAAPVLDCEGTVDGPALPGTPCIYAPSGYGGMWSADCVCIENVGVGEIAGLSGFAIYPNPASTTLFITTATGTPVHVKVYDMVGTLVLEKDMVQQLDITKLATGSYTLVATDAKGGNEQHARFMKQ